MEDRNPEFGQQPRHHPRPFFYVQPPSQPYYMYQQWQLNPSYAPYTLPGAYSVGRACVPQYPYGPYPFLPAAPPLHPLDYRRLFEPRFPCQPWHDAPRAPPPQGSHQRGGEPPCAHTADAGDTVAPGDALAKLIACLSKIRAGELGAERELDSGVASQGSQGPGGGQGPGEGHPETPAGGRGLEACWPGGLEEEEEEEEEAALPLDSSSVHEDRHDDQRLEPEEPPVGPPEAADLRPPEGGNAQGVSPERPADPLAELALQLPLGGALSPLPAAGGRRISVLSPSLEELSSRDELLSTDLDELEPPWARPPVWAWGAGGPRYTCACCGSRLAGRGPRPPARQDSDEEEEEEPPEKPLPPRHAPRRRQREEAARRTAQGTLLKDGLCREGTSPLDPVGWQGADLKPRRKQIVLHRQDMTTGRKRPSRPVCPRSRDEERKDEEEGPPHLHRGSTNDNREVF